MLLGQLKLPKMRLAVFGLPETADLLSARLALRPSVPSRVAD